MLGTSSSSAGVYSSAQRQRSIGARLRQFRAAIFSLLGLCFSGRHLQRDRSARAMCCNGWRPSWSAVSINGDLHRVASWRALSAADPRFPWERGLRAGENCGARLGSWLPPSTTVDSRFSGGSGFYSSCDVEPEREELVFRNLDPDSDYFGPELAPRKRRFDVPALADGTPDYSTEQRLSRLDLSLSITDRHLIGASQ